VTAHSAAPGRRCPVCGALTEGKEICGACLLAKVAGVPADRRLTAVCGVHCGVDGRDTGSARVAHCVTCHQLAEATT
jgi:hypothetical protein